VKRGQEMSQCMLQYVITCTSEIPFEKMMATFDPLLLAEIGLVLTNILGEKCELEIETIEMVAAEDMYEQSDY